MPNILAFMKTCPAQTVLRKLGAVILSLSFLGLGSGKVALGAEIQPCSGHFRDLWKRQNIEGNFEDQARSCSPSRSAKYENPFLSLGLSGITFEDKNAEFIPYLREGATVEGLSIESEKFRKPVDAKGTDSKGQMWTVQSDAKFLKATLKISELESLYVEHEWGNSKIVSIHEFGAKRLKNKLTVEKSTSWTGSLEPGYTLEALWSDGSSMISGTAMAVNDGGSDRKVFSDNLKICLPDGKVLMLTEIGQSPGCQTPIFGSGVLDSSAMKKFSIPFSDILKATHVCFLLPSMTDDGIEFETLNVYESRLESDEKMLVDFSIPDLARLTFTMFSGKADGFFHFFTSYAGSDGYFKAGKPEGRWKINFPPPSRGPWREYEEGSYKDGARVSPWFFISRGLAGTQCEPEDSECYEMYDAAGKAKGTICSVGSEYSAELFDQGKWVELAGSSITGLHYVTVDNEIICHAKE